MNQKPTIRSVSVSDVSDVRKFVKSCDPLTVHTAVTYGILFHLFPELCFVAESEERIVGYASAIRGSSQMHAVYCWQIGIDPQYRGTGLAMRLVEARLKAGESIGCTHAQVGIEPSNEISLGLWKKVAANRGTELVQVGEVSFADELTDSSEFDVVWELGLKV